MHVDMTIKPQRLIGTGTSYLQIGAESQGRVSRHEEVKPRGGDEGRNESDQVVVHVAGVTECCCTC